MGRRGYRRSGCLWGVGGGGRFVRACGGGTISLQCEEEMCRGQNAYHLGRLRGDVSFVAVVTLLREEGVGAGEVAAVARGRAVRWRSGADDRVS